MYSMCVYESFCSRKRVSRLMIFSTNVIYITKNTKMDNFMTWANRLCMISYAKTLTLIFSETFFFFSSLKLIFLKKFSSKCCAVCFTWKLILFSSFLIMEIAIAAVGANLCILVVSWHKLRVTFSKPPSNKIYFFKTIGHMEKSIIIFFSPFGSVIKHTKFQSTTP